MAIKAGRKKGADGSTKTKGSLSFMPERHLQPLDIPRIREAICSLEKTGEFAPVLKAVGAEHDPQLMLQRAISSSDDREIRDVLEDISFWLAQGKVP